MCVMFLHCENKWGLVKCRFWRAELSICVFPDELMQSGDGGRSGKMVLGVY